MKIYIFPVFVHNSCSANQIPRFLNPLFLQNKSMKQPHFLHVDTNLQELKVNQIFFGWAWSKLGVAILICGP